LVLTSKVAVVEFDGHKIESLKQAIRLIGGIDDLNTAERPVVVKVGVFSHRAGNHASVSVVDAIVNSFDSAPKIFLADSDNYQGCALERLQLWKELFSERVVPFSLSDDADTKSVRLADQEMKLSHVLFKPSVLVSTHILRSFDKGSILKNLFGCIPTAKKVKYHKVLPVLLADVCEAVGGIDLAVLDGTHFWEGAGDNPVQMNTLLVGRDAVAVETVGVALAGMNPDEVPVIREFASRGLGEGDLDNIEIIGASFERLKEKFLSAAKTQKKLQPSRRGPQTWGGHAYHELDNLLRTGFFKVPNKRTVEEVAKALEARRLQSKGKENKIADSMNRKVKKGVLKKAKTPKGWVYWAE